MKSPLLFSIGYVLLALICAPLLPGIINRVKAIFAGRQGQPILQPYYDLFRLLQKGVVYSRTATPLFYLAPIINLAAFLTALALLPPVHGAPALFAFSGDLILFAYLLGLTRFFTVLAALDTGSSFEGMGASREVFFSALAEPAFFIILATLVAMSGHFSLSALFESNASSGFPGPEIFLMLVSLFLILLAENSRIPVDDPNTHLELTMIHEVMVLDHSGPDLGFILYGSSLKLWLLAVIFARIAFTAISIPQWLIPFSTGIVLIMVAVAIGIVESIMARLRLIQVPQFLVGAGILAILGFIFSR